ncbi:MAG: glycosyltransferase family 2 protein [Methyloversatilis sp.]|uniref:glycosyltransferase family 2 protein n=1 Tax=Methyloversatilis sp. TaxID=2569862 RepID=UPI002736F4E6|nr:glycosyltransferase family 2 protein [Methyloversatilis sp.]MDP3871358.1 glycosyltransferase family 2 protein [Methyloversatilis sp.]
MEIASAVSVVIVNYNAGPGLVDAVRSAISDAREVVVVDNASTDGSLSCLRATFVGDSRLRIVRNEENLGFARACNRGVSEATGDFLLFLNPDCELDSGAMLGLLAVMLADGEVGMAGGLLLNPDGSEQAGGRRAVPTPWRSLVRTVGLSKLARRWPRVFFDFYLHKQPLPAQPVEVEAISGACMLVRRNAMLDVGPLDEAYFMHCEDLDWCMRFRLSKWKIMFVPAAGMVHHHGVCSRARPIFVAWHKHRGMMLFYRKFFRHQYPGVVMWLVAIGVWLRFAFVVVRYLPGHVRSVLGLKRD